MPRRTGSFEFSIRGDELEQHRIQLEHNLQHTDLSLHLSSTPEEQSDVEYPRHNSAPENFNGFASFDHISRDNFDPDESHYHAWSYRTGDDDHGISPYEGRTISTAAHHASALTFSAGLGGRGTRRDVSVSGAEYDPDRPLTGIIAGMASSRLPNFDADSTKSKHLATTTVDFDPLVVDDSAELDEVLQHGRVPIPTSGLRSPSTASSSSRPNTPMSPRPKLSDALHQVAFSPKRPRNMPSPAAHRTASTHAQSARARAASARHPQRSVSTRARAATVHSDPEDENPTPRSRSKMNNSQSHVAFAQSLSYANIEPEVNVLPPTPPNEESASRFTRMARGLAREIEEQSRHDAHRRDRDREMAQSTVRRPSRGNRVPLRSVVSELQDNPPPRPRSAGSRTPHRSGRVYLPDVTGLTSAVASPAKLGLDYRSYDARDDREIDVRLATTLNVVQSKLAHLESENSISRRRVRELELELEECKKEVARERTRMEQSMRQHDEEFERRERAAAKARKAREAELQNEEDYKRYKEVVQEKKALEALIGTLQAHLTRLTKEIADHSCMLRELRVLRDSDARSLKDKSEDVNTLRQEVERLAGEVEVLRGVVEEGLKERREVREQSMERGHSVDHSAVGPILQAADVTDLSVNNQVEEDEQSDSDGSSSGRSTPSPRPSPVRRPRLGDGTMRTDVATLGSSPQDAALYGTPFFDSQDLQRISEEVSERRSERSSAASTTADNTSRATLPMASYSDAPHDARPYVEHRPDSRAYRRDDSDNDSETAVRGTVKGKAPERSLSRASSVQGPTRTSTPVRDPSPQPSTSRAAEPRRTTQPKQAKPSIPAKQQPKAESSKAAAGEAPFPQIRGGRLEQLFFSAPDHNANTCTVCNRRRRAKPGHRRTWSTTAGHPHADGEDEGFVEGFDEPKLRWNYKGKEREHASDDRVPPQTVLTRVLRELEDDFTHYKSIYVELADQYKDMDPISNVAKRNVLAEHLREVIDILEQKGDQIASLYDLLTFGDKPVEQPTRPSGARTKVM